MITALLKLKNWLISQALDEEAGILQDLSEYTEPWHEEAVQEFGSEPVSEEDYLEQFREPSGVVYSDPARTQTYESILKKEKFTPISGSRKVPYLSAGAYGVVFRGIYQGQPAVAKIIVGNQGDQEIKVWEKILESKDKLSPEFQKHIPQIYALLEGEIKDKYADQLRYQMVVMEELKPLNSQISSVVKSKENSNKKEVIKSILKNEEYLWQAALDLSKEANEFFQKEILEPGTVLKFLLEYQYQEEEDDDIPNLEPLIEKIFQYYQDKFQIQGREASQLKDLISDYITNYISIYPIYSQFPTSEKNLYGDVYFENLPETQSLLATLKMLSENFGISWKDLHSKNMMLGQDGNLKFIDVGLYELGNSKQKTRTRNLTKPTLSSES